MKVAVIADSHFDEGSRFEECVRLHDWIADDLAAKGVSLVLHAGDVYERRSTAKERLAVAAWLTKCAAVAPVVVVRGNHDTVGDLSLLSQLETLHPITVEERAAVHTFGIPADGREYKVAVACLAWPRRAALLAGLGDDAPESAATDALRNVLLGMRKRDGFVTILLAHAMVRGSVTSHGQPLVGCDMEIGLEDLALVDADVYALGHIHKGQEWTIDGKPVFYPGSPRRTAFGEVESKGYTVVELNESGVVGWTHVEAPATPMVLLEGQYTPGSEGAPGRIVLSPPTSRAPMVVDGAEIRFRYRVASDEREAGSFAAETFRGDLMSLGAVSVKLEEEVSATARARAPEVAKALTLIDKLRALWAARNEVPEEGREVSLLAKVNQLEEGVAA